MAVTNVVVGFAQVCQGQALRVLRFAALTRGSLRDFWSSRLNVGQKNGRFLPS